MLKKLNLNLKGKDGNAFALLGYFKKQAQQAGWADNKIKTKLDEAKNGDYDHLLQVLMDC